MRLALQIMNLRLLFLRLSKLAQIIRSKRLRHVLLRHSVAAGTEHRSVLTQKLSTVVDIGANRGQFALSVRQYAPDAKVICFEPLHAAANTFKQIFEKDKRVSLHQSAIGFKSGDTSIHVSAEDDSSSLLPISKYQRHLFPGTEEVRTEIVSVGRLVDFVSENDITVPAMLKLDVQGFELEALRGCEDLLYRFEHVYVECSFIELYSGQALAHEVVSWLHNTGFIIKGIYNTYYDRNGIAIQADFLFCRKEM